MEHAIAKLIHDFEQGKLTRRQLIQSVAATAAIAAGAGTAIGQSKTLTAVGVDHISYQVADYRKTRDLYSDLFGMKVTADNGKQCNLTVGNTSIIARNGTAGTPKVDHFAFSIDNWNDAAVEAELKRRGLEPKPEGEHSFQFRDPDGFHVQLSPKKS